ncbi:Uu.00g022000.m01.CDS01 [Anthostomella pinea]|uniref:Uu.00g022000.m01.CDS01 n=1 Tax=Anthostomella pinea TaxID=933095 RepID=A0AAI8VTY0_9PEZI|nr:Uu.00g022000.m01.CDS01 [Anthostomella pinea]
MSRIWGESFELVDWLKPRMAKEVEDCIPYSVECDALTIALVTGQTETALWLVQHAFTLNIDNPSQNTQAPGENATLFLRFFKKQWYSEATKRSYSCYWNRGANVDARHSCGVTALHWAAERGYSHYCNILMGAGASCVLPFDHDGLHLLDHTVRNDSMLRINNLLLENATAADKHLFCYAIFRALKHQDVALGTIEALVMCSKRLGCIPSSFTCSYITRPFAPVREDPHGSLLHAAVLSPSCRVEVVDLLLSNLGDTASTPLLDAHGHSAIDYVFTLRKDEAVVALVKHLGCYAPKSYAVQCAMDRMGFT